MSTETVWKFALDGVDTTLTMPEGATLLSIAQQHRQIVLWARVNPDAPEETRRIHLVGTGTEVPADAGEFIGTAVCDGGTWVFHAFEHKAVSR